jgi:hypothetical protein
VTAGNARTAAPPAKPAAPVRSGGRSASIGKRSAKKRILRRPRTLVIGVAVLAGAGAFGYTLLPHASPPHAISTPARVGGFVQEPSMVTSAGASSLRSHIVASSAGEATRVVDAVYEATVSAKANPLIVVFVGGHLAGSAGSFIASLTQALPGAFTIHPGSMQGQAACAPGQGNRPAECAWADNDTFGVLLSPSLSASALGAELRAMRPRLEHVVR